MEHTSNTAGPEAIWAGVTLVILGLSLPNIRFIFDVQRMIHDSRESSRKETVKANKKSPPKEMVLKGRSC